MKRILLTSLALLMAFTVMSQDTFTDRLQKAVEGQGMVRILQDAEITALVNGKRLAAPVSSTGKTGGHIRQTTDTVASILTDTMPLSGGRKVRMNGYRVQVYAGGNSREAQRRAYQVEGQVKALVPEQPVYTRFVRPRWICHVGDFRTRAEALELLDQLRKTGRFPEAITVRCKINAFVYE